VIASTSAAPINPPTPEQLKRLEAAMPRVDSRGGSVGALALAAEVPVEVAQAAMDDPATAARLVAACEAAEDGGHVLKAMAARITGAMLAKLNEAVTAGQLDIDDLGNLLPKVHRIVEHADRMEVARGDSSANLPVFHIHFGTRGRASISVVAHVEPAAVEMAEEVFDIDSAAPTAAMAQASAINAAMAQALAINADALDGSEVPSQRPGYEVTP
jgi:hypothetical protein